MTSAILAAKRDWAATMGCDDEDEGDDDEVDKPKAKHHGNGYVPTTATFRLAEEDLCRAIETQHQWHVSRLVLCNHSAARQVVVTGHGNLEALKIAMKQYLGKVPWVYVEAILDTRPRRRVVVKHDGCPDEPTRVTCKLEALPEWGTYTERLVPGHEISPGVQSLGKYFIASVNGNRIGSYSTPEAAKGARDLYLTTQEGCN